MNILYLCDEYPPCQHGGIGTVTQTLARSISNKGNKVVVAGFYPYYRKAAERENDKGVEVYRFFYGNRLKLILSKRVITGRLVTITNNFNHYIEELKKIISEHKIDIIESPDFVEAFRYSGPRMLEFPSFGVPFIVKLHGSYFVIYDHSNKKFGNPNIFIKEKNLLNFADDLIAVSTSVKERVVRKFGIEKKITVLYNGISLENAQISDDNSRDNYVVFAGTLSENKGIFNLIEAWERVIEKFPKTRLLIYGEGTKASLNKINKLVNSEIQETIEIRGFTDIEKLKSIYSQASCAIFPSYGETLGMAPIEAMSVGCPTIFTRRTSGPEVIHHGIDGLLINPDNIQEIAESIILLLTDRQLAFKIGSNAIKKIRNTFDISIVADRHIDHYNHIIRRDFK